jgi:hypothetical protein
MTTIENFTAEEQNVIRLYAIIARFGMNVIADYRALVNNELDFGSDDKAAHAYAVKMTALKYRIR